MNALASFRLAFRTLGRSPLFTVTTIGSLAIGIAASSTIFSLADALFLRPRAGIASEGQLVDVGRATNGQGFDNFGYQVLLALQQATQLEGLAGFRLDANAVSLGDGRGGSVRAYATPVTANYFSVLGTRAAAGSLFLGDEDRVPDGAPVVVISHAFWLRRFGGAADVVGTALGINGRPYTIVGVTQPGFTGTTFVGTDMWVPFAMAPHVTGRATMELLTEHGPVWHLGIARLKEGVSIQRARDELNALLAPLKQAHADSYGRWSMAVVPSARVPGEFRGPVAAFVGVLFALTLIVLAIACSNVASMLLARAISRRREIATRLAVGAGRGHLVAQLLTETAALFLLAAVASIALAWWRSCSRSYRRCPCRSPWSSRWTCDSWASRSRSRSLPPCYSDWHLRCAPRASTSSPRCTATTPRPIAAASTCGTSSSERRSRCRWCCWSRPACSCARCRARRMRTPGTTASGCGSSP